MLHLTFALAEMDVFVALQNKLAPFKFSLLSEMLLTMLLFANTDDVLKT